MVPALCALVFFSLPLEEPTRNILLLMSTMPGAIGSILISDIYEGDSDLATSGVLLTHIAALVTVPVWLLILSIL